MLFKRAFSGCRAGDIYPTQFRVGEECPPELRKAATEDGALESTADAKARVAAGRKEEAEAQKRVAALLDLARDKNVAIGEQATEAEIVAALTAAGVEIPQA